MKTKSKTISNSKSVTLMSRGIIYLFAFGIFSICAILLPEFAREEKAANPNAGAAWPFFVGAWILSVPVFAALWEAHKILSYIDKDIAFSELTVKSLQKIKRYSFTYALMILVAAVSMVIIGRRIDPTEDMPPIIMFGTILSFTAIVIGTFAATVEKLIKDALNLKEENDLII